jgi:diacylglycerol O-acyltransferase-1
MFYSVFHSYLNLCGELLRFGDRLFYRDWWNAQTLDVYWRNWNLPVHNVFTLCSSSFLLTEFILHSVVVMEQWIVRHLYAPAQRHGLSNLQAQALAFFASAALHEVGL